MTSPLLTTKLHIPPARPNLVARRGCFQKLDQGLGQPLTLISAPPGFGKTTLATIWLEQQPLPTAWYSLDERDNDLTRFLTYLVAALETVQADVGRQALNRLHSRHRPSLESVVTLLSNDIAAIPRDFVLALDDYHLIELQAIHEAMAFLLDHLPPPLHLVITSRADPPFPLTRLRARGQLVEVRAPDLRFSPEEAAAFLNQRMGLNLTAEQVAALDARAEGWIAGLQLAGLAMQAQVSLPEHQDVAAFVNAFTGSHRFVLDYLAEEVLQRQTPEIQSFLLQTSILDQMNAALADAVTERNDSAQILAHLEKVNLFLVPLDEAHHWYRYHHLFDDLLQARLLQLHPEMVADLNRRASAWYEQNGMINEAIDHALAGPDFERAAHLIEQVGLMMAMHSEDATVLKWLAQLPDSMIRSRPWLCLIDAGALMSIGKMDLAGARLAQVDEAQLDPQGRGVAALLRAAMLLLDADVPRAIDSLHSAFEAAAASATTPGDPQAEFNAIGSLYLAVVLAELQFIAGQLYAAAATCRRGIEIGNSFTIADPWTMILGFIDFALAELHYEWNEIGAAEQRAGQSIEISRAGRNQEFESYALVALAEVKQVQGDPASAFDLIQKATQLVRKRHIASEVRFVVARQVKVLIAQDRIDEAAREVSELPSEDAVHWIFERGMVSTARARVLIAQRKFGQAVQLLETVVESAQANGQTGTVIEACALLALAQQGQGNTAQALTTLARALELAEPEGYVRTFVDCGTTMQALLQKMTDDGRRMTDVYAHKLLAAFGTMPQEKSHATTERTSTAVVRPLCSGELLSERELVVLRLIAEGLSNQEIADRLVVAVSTVKTHINNIYGKLGAGNRTQALARAHERKLL